MKKNFFAAMLTFAIVLTSLSETAAYGAMIPDEDAFTGSEEAPIIDEDIDSFQDISSDGAGTAAGGGTITGFEPLDSDEIIMEYKLAIFSLIKKLPDTLNAYTDDNDECRRVKVSWECLDDYDTELTSYRFKAVPELKVRVGVSLPVINVSFTDDGRHGTGGIPIDMSMYMHSVPADRTKEDQIEADKVLPDLPVRFNSYEDGKLTPVKNQGKTGTCWVFTAIGCAEADLIHDNKADTSIDLSELHTAYYSSHTYKDPKGNLAGESLEYAGNEELKYLDSAGNGYKAAQSLINGLGPAAEEDIPFSLYRDTLTKEGQFPDRYARSFNKVQLKSLKAINVNDIDNVKTAIMEHGGVETIICAPGNEDVSHFSDTYDSYISKTKSVNHVVMLVGWDDDFSREKFPRYTPENDGAWLVRNSWGLDDYGMNGYFWMSYEDVSWNFGAQVLAYDMDADARDNCYAYSRFMLYLGGGKLSKYNNTHIFSQSYHVGCGETVKEVGFELYPADHTGCQIKITAEAPDSAQSTAMLNITEGGYYTTELSNPFEVTETNGADIKITLEIDGESYSIPWETASEGTTLVELAYRTEVQGGGAEIDGELHEEYDSRIRLFTDNTSVPVPSKSVVLDKNIVSLRHKEEAVISLDPLCTAYGGNASDIKWVTDRASVAQIKPSADKKSVTVTTGTKYSVTRICCYYKYNEEDGSYEDMAECEVKIIPYSISYTGITDDVIQPVPSARIYFPGDSGVGGLYTMFRPGYDHEGYYSGSTPSIRVSTAMLQEGKVTGDLTLYPKWTPRNLTIYYMQPEMDSSSDGKLIELGTVTADSFPMTLPDAGDLTGISGAYGWNLSPDGQDIIDTLTIDKAFTISGSKYSQNDSITLYPAYGILRLNDDSVEWAASTLTASGYKVSATIERVDADGNVLDVYTGIAADDISIEIAGEETIYTAGWVRNGKLIGSATKVEKAVAPGTRIEGVSIDHDTIAQNGLALKPGYAVSNLKVKVTPKGAVSGNVIWKSDNEEVAIVEASKDNGTGFIKITAGLKKTGTAIIRAFIDGNEVYRFPVEVYDPAGLIIVSEGTDIFPESSNKTIKKSFVYAGAPRNPEIAVYFNNTLLSKGKDYTVSYKDNVNISPEDKPATITVSSKNKAFKDQIISYYIIPLDISRDYDLATAEDLYYPYKSEITVKPVVTVTDSNGRAKSLKYGRDFVFRNTDDRKLSPAFLTPSPDGYSYFKTVTLKGIGNYTGERDITVTVAAKEAVNMNSVNAAKIPVQNATGGPLTPAPVLSYKKLPLTEGTDYTVSYINNIQAGTASAVITGKGKYVGRKTVAFKIKGIKLSKEMFGMSDIEYQVNLSADKVNSLIFSTLDSEDYYFDLSKDLKGKQTPYLQAGRYSLTVHGMGKYEGKQVLNFSVTAKPLERDWFETGSNPVKSLTKDGTRPYDSSDKLKLKTDYTVSYSGNKKTGNALAVIRGKGNYKGTIKIPYIVTE